jgi:hypothetical protein
MVEGNDVIFREEQRFSLRFAVPLILIMMLLAGISIKIVVLLNRGGYTSGWAILLIVLIVLLGIALPISVSVLLLLATLETEVRPDGFYVRFFPVHVDFKRFALEELDRYHARQYKPLREYGALGMRLGGKNRIYRISGDKSVQLLLKNGTQLLIGSQKPYELVEAINSIAKNS